MEIRLLKSHTFLSRSEGILSLLLTSVVPFDIQRTVHRHIHL